MKSPAQVIRELEDRRRALNERLMNSTTVADANSIERELWALRARIRYHKRKIPNRATDQDQQVQDQQVKKTPTPERSFHAGMM